MRNKTRLISRWLTIDWLLNRSTHSRHTCLRYRHLGHSILFLPTRSASLLLDVSSMESINAKTMNANSRKDHKIIIQVLQGLKENFIFGNCFLNILRILKHQRVTKHPLIVSVNDIHRLIYFWGYKAIQASGCACYRFDQR